MPVDPIFLLFLCRNLISPPFLTKKRAGICTRKQDGKEDVQNHLQHLVNRFCSLPAHNYQMWLAPYGSLNAQNP